MNLPYDPDTQPRFMTIKAAKAYLYGNEGKAIYPYYKAHTTWGFRWEKDPLWDKCPWEVLTIKSGIVC